MAEEALLKAIKKSSPRFAVQFGPELVVGRPVTAAYRESEHPRDPGGEGGGQWIPKGTTGVDEAHAPGDPWPGGFAIEQLPIGAKFWYGGRMVELVGLSETGTPIIKANRRRPFELPNKRQRTQDIPEGAIPDPAPSPEPPELPLEPAPAPAPEPVPEPIPEPEPEPEPPPPPPPPPPPEPPKPKAGPVLLPPTALPPQLPTTTSQRKVTGEMGKLFSSTPPANSPITAAANLASQDLADIGMTFPDNSPKVPLVVTTGRSYSGRFETQEYGHNGQVVSATMRLRRGPEDDMVNTLHHETGHLMDRLLLQRYNTEQGTGNDPRRNYASHAGPDSVTAGVMDAIRNSSAVARTRDMAENPRSYSIQGYNRSMPIDRQHVARYLPTPTEQFARAYEQYIGTKTGRRMLQYVENAAPPPGQVTVYDGQGPGDLKGFYGWYWQVDDFKPIELEFDKMFRRVGWLKN